MVLCSIVCPTNYRIYFVEINILLQPEKFLNIRYTDIRVGSLNNFLEFPRWQLTNPSHRYEMHLGQIWANLVQNWISKIEKTVYLVTLLANLEGFPPRDLCKPIAQPWVNSANCTIQHFKAEILPFLKWYGNSKSDHYFFKKFVISFFHQFIL